MERRPSRLATVLIPLATAAAVLAVALPSREKRPRQPLAADVWPGFDPQPSALPDLGGLMLKLAVDRRDVPLEMRFEDSIGGGFDWPVGDLYTGLDQQWVGLLEPGDWRVSIRRRDDPRPLAQRRFSLLGGRTHGLALDLRTGLDEDPPTADVTFAIDFGQLAATPTARVVPLDGLYAARRAGEADPEGEFLELSRSADGTRFAAETSLARGEYVLSLAPFGLESVFHVGDEPLEVVHDAPLATVTLALADRQGMALPDGTQVWWTSAPRPGAPTPMWHAPNVETNDEAPAFTTTVGELRLVVRVPGRKPEGVRVPVPPEGGRVHVRVGPRRPAAG